MSKIVKATGNRQQATGKSEGDLREKTKNQAIAILNKLSTIKT
jgi:hypothetical protein